MKKFLTPALAASVLCFAAPDVFAQYQVTTLGSAVVENFNGMQMPTGAGVTNINFNGALADTTQSQRNSAWVLSSTAGQGNQTGSGTSGGWQAYGNTAATTDKSLGQLGNGSYSGGNATATYINASGLTVTSFILSYTGEQWRANSGPGSITVQYSINGGSFNSLATSTFTATIVNNVNTANATTAAGALNGDAAGNRATGLGATVSSISLAAGQNIQFRFLYTVGSNSKGVSIDDISVTFNGGAPTTGNYWSEDVGGGGTGTWTSAGTNWATGPAGADRGVTQGNGTLVFGDTSGTVTVSGGVTASAGMQFTTTGYTIQSSTIALAGADAVANTITTGAGITATINSQLTGTTGMTKVGAGSLFLGGANTFTGTTTVGAGVLALDSAGSLASSVSLASGTTLDLTAKSSGYALASGTTLSGTGSVTTASDQTVSVGTGATIQPGTATTSGTLTLTGLTFASGGTYAFSIGNVAGTPGTAWDLISVGSDFDITATSGSKFNISVGGNSGNPTNFYNTGNYSWDILTLASGSITGFDASAFNFINNFAGSDGTFSLTSDGTKLTLNYLAGTPQTLTYASPSSTTWLTAANWGGLVPGPGDTARIGANPTSGNLGINMNTAGGNYGVAAIEVTSDRTGAVTISNSSTSASGTLTLAGATVNGVDNVVLRNNSSGTLTITNGASQTMNVALGNATDNVVVIDNSGGITIGSAITGTGRGLTLTGAGTGALTLSGANTYTGPTSILDGRLILALNSSVTSDVTVGALGAIGGRGTITGDLSLDAGADFVFDLNGPLLVNSGTVSFGGLSITDIVGLTSATANGVYTLIDGTATINFANVSNFGEEDPFALGDGKFAYFKEGSLQVEVVPEPSTYALLTLAAAGLGAHLIRRRRR